MASFVSCFQTCTPGDMMCGQACAAQHPDGLPEVQAVSMCQMGSCSDVCN